MLVLVPQIAPLLFWRCARGGPLPCTAGAPDQGVDWIGFPIRRSGDHFPNISIPVVFYPRFKYRFLEFRFTQSFGTDADICLKRVQRVLEGMFDEYSSQLNDCNVDPTQHGCSQETLTNAIQDDDPFVDWYQHIRNNIPMTTELDRYLNESPIQQSEELDILKWWMVYSPIYPTLARIAQDVLAMPMSTVVSKSGFSMKK
jgi:hypothetical protein